MSFRDMTPDEHERFRKLYPKENLRRARILMADVRRSVKDLEELMKSLPPSSRLCSPEELREIQQEASQRHELRQRRNMLRRKGIRSKRDLIRKIGTCDAHTYG